MRPNERFPFLVLFLITLLVLGIALGSAYKSTEMSGRPQDFPFLSVDFVKAQIMEQAISHHVNPQLMVAVAGCESGWVWSARSPDGHDVGVWQISDYGLAQAFYAEGFHSRYNSFESSVFAAEQFANGNASAWSCWWFQKNLWPPWWRGHWGG